MQQSVCISKHMVYWCLWVCMRRSLEAVLTQLSDYSGILGHREIRPIGKTTGEKQRKYHSVVLMKQHREKSWLSDLTLRGFKTNPGKVREAKLKKIQIQPSYRGEGVCVCVRACVHACVRACVREMNLLYESISVYLSALSCRSCATAW